MSDMYTPKTQKGIFGNIVLWVLALVLLCGALGIGLWAFGVFTSNVKGAGDAQRIKNSGVNRIQKQELFEQLDADYTGYLAKITVARQAVADARAAGDATTLGLRQTELEGIQQTCIDTAQQYNAESRKYTARDFKSAGLPATLDTTKCAKGAS